MRSVPRRGRARGHLALTALASVLLTACTAGPSARPPVVENDGPTPQPPPSSSRQVPLPGLEEPGGSGIDWSECGPEVLDRLGERPGNSPSVSCARMTSTLDAPDLPGRGITRIGLLKAGDGPVPLVVVNDVDGEPGTLYAARLAASMPGELLRRFSLIGVDRRGTGTSDPVRCVPGDVRATLLNTDPTRSFDTLLDAARVAGQQCAINLEDQQAALDGWRAAGDLDELREQLGLRHLNALGHGEGSRVVALYAARYPGRVGRTVLDGVPDPSTDMVTVVDGVAAGAEATLDAFSADCAGRECALGGDARAEVAELAEQLRSRPLHTADGITMGAPLALRAVLQGLADRQRWPLLADAITAARSGDAGPLAEFVRPLLLESQDSAARLDGSLATRCNDTATRLPADRLRRVARELGDRYAVFGSVVAQQLAWCSPWPSRGEPAPEIGAEGAPPMLVVSTAVDPVTPERGTIRAAERMPSAVRLAWQGSGHGALNSACVMRAVQRFLVDGDVPRDGTLCPA
ncbi:lysophospholipase [Saccharomonospora marina XMU15]|uniref:Lysophospholipase n=1 Tax=Saccharomonospora marina XMU15 TaxID=882083 RepID=H5WWK2_9PSEU|nr:lysophospholipase [Saccharomonospora marina XMU15]